VLNWNGCDGSSTTRTQRISTPADVPVRQVSKAGWGVPRRRRVRLQSGQQRPLTRYFPEVVAGLVERIPDGTWQQRTCESQRTRPRCRPRSRAHWAHGASNRVADLDDLIAPLLLALPRTTQMASSRPRVSPSRFRFTAAPRPGRGRPASWADGPRLRSWSHARPHLVNGQAGVLLKDSERYRVRGDVRVTAVLDETDDALVVGRATFIRMET
jgi:hypothetical protein